MKAQKSILVYLIEDSFVWLGMKKKNYSKGKWNGFGGKVEENESLKQAAVREVKEEVEIEIIESSLERIAKFFYHEPDGNWQVNIFLCDKWEGNPKETDEMKPKKFRVDNLPLKDMWENDTLWIEDLIVNKKKLKGTFWHNEKGEVIKHELVKKRKV